MEPQRGCATNAGVTGLTLGTRGKGQAWKNLTQESAFRRKLLLVPVYMCARVCARVCLQERGSQVAQYSLWKSGLPLPITALTRDDRRHVLTLCSDGDMLSSSDNPEEGVIPI